MDLTEAEVSTLYVWYSSSIFSSSRKALSILFFFLPLLLLSYSQTVFPTMCQTQYQELGMQWWAKQTQKNRYLSVCWFTECSKCLYCCYLVTQSWPTLLQLHGLSPTRLLHPWDFPGKTMGVSCHFPLQRIFQIQGWNPHLLLGRQILYHWASLSSPFISAIIAGRLALWGLVGFPILRPCSIIPCAFPIFT